MLKMVRDNIVLPMLGRVGTAASLALVGYGMGVEHVDVVSTAFTVMGGVGFDLVTSWVSRVVRERKILDGGKIQGGQQD